MKRILLIGLAPLVLGAPATAQVQQNMPEMAPGMAMPTSLRDPHAGHAGASAVPTQAANSGTDLLPGNAPAPAVQHDRAADRFFDKSAMDEAEGRLLEEHGGMTYHQLLFNLAEYQVRDGRDGYRWDGQFWIGGDLNRLALKSSGEGTFGKRIEHAEIQALYSRALDPYWNMQAGIRQDFGAGRSRTYAALGVEGLAPYWFEVEGALFLSDKGDLLARASAYYDQRITERLILQPRIELNFAAQDMAESRIGSGLSDAELGLRLRYETAREFAPYIGISYDAKAGRTADYARADGEQPASTSFVAGVRFWF